MDIFFNNNKNPHPAATARFAAYGEIVSNFAYMPFSFKKQKGMRNGDAFKNENPVNSNILLLAVSLILSIILTILLNKNIIINPAFIFMEYICIWVILSLFLIVSKNKINNINISQKIDAKSLPGNFKNSAGNISCQTGIYKKNKPFDLGILSGNKKFPNMLIGLDRKKRFEHTLIVSPTGGGKTSRYIIPNIINDAKYANLSIFTIDIDSPYLYESVKKEWMEAGKRIIHFDPYFHGGQGGALPKIHFNPLIDKQKKHLSNDKLYNLSSLLFYPDRAEINGGDVHAHKYYSKRSSDIFYGCLLYLKYKYEVKYFNLITAKSFFEKGVKFIEGEIIKFNGENNKKIKELFNNFLELPPFERAKIITDILNALDFLNDENVTAYFKSNTGIDKDKMGSGDFFIEDFFDSDTLFIIGIPKERINSGGAKLMSFITNIFINGIYEDRRKRLRADINQISGSENKDEPRDIFMYLDEFPALSLNNFDVELANLRKTNTAVCLTVQDIAFIKSKYRDTSLITANIGTHIVMGHASHGTCEYYSGMSGEKYVFHKELIKRDTQSLWYDALHETPVASGLYPLISADEIKNMDGGSVLIYTKYINPFILNLKP
ncbi:MAG: type IV secretory system conjugative DNA transfer family protein [Deltaproteobacteria bacterium]|jgi:type IV secretory pathway TraG/TraD family ATPase VirD4|nr:type IV secretory system conjugative DNA transfer family protein [Deltaproteobacteria bacterium]MCL5879648.1 type IV secretory system conjugative DNA transfer family protein [Deltaproteobacteria bacterium]MDA8304093.1 type IV secretory system conjugative DNA transfer family protein [Deltaproteobacteria bacterium]